MNHGDTETRRHGDTEKKGEGGLQRQAAEAVRQHGGVEIEDEADGTAAQAEIGQQLRVVHGQQVVNCLDLDDDDFVDDDIKPVATVNRTDL